MNCELVGMKAARELGEWASRRAGGQAGIANLSVSFFVVIVVVLLLLLRIHP